MAQPKPDTITLDDAIKYARNWRGQEGTYNAHNELHAFLIPKDDFLGILTEEIDAVRAYIGVNPDTNEEKLMFVGTKYDQPTDTYIDLLPGTPEDYNIYDMTMPCPRCCDNNSVLNQAK